MKKLFLPALFTCCINFCFAQFTVNDTTFLVRETANNIYHAVYFEKNKNSEFYKYISDFGFTEFDGIREYQEGIDVLKQYYNKTKLKKTSLNGVSTKWCMLYLLKDIFYVYSPSDYCWNFQNEITDSVFISKGCEKTFSIIDTIVKKNEHFFQLKMKSIRRNFKNEKIIRTINIYIIDKQKGIAVFEDNYWGKKEYRLMVEASKVNNFPLIINYCETSKQGEFEFDKVDYSALIKKYQSQ